jgi:hypothetical protein
MAVAVVELDVDGIELPARDVGVLGNPNPDAHLAAVWKRRCLLDRAAAEAHGRSLLGPPRIETSGSCAILGK